MIFDFSDYRLRNRGYSKSPMTILDPGSPPREMLSRITEIALIETEPLSIGESMRTLLKVRTLRRGIYSIAWGGPADVAFGLFFPLMLAQEYGLNATQRSFLFIPGIVTAFLGSLVGGALIDYFSARKPTQVLVVTGVYGLISSLALAMLALQPPIGYIVAIQAIFAFGSGVTGPARGAILTQVVPPNIRNTGGALSQLAQLPGYIIWTPMALAIFSAFGFKTVLWFGFPFAVISAVTASARANPWPARPA